jgi:hypothetical protein
MNNLNKKLFYIILTILCVSISSGQNVKGNLDNGRGEWIQVEKGKFEYKISEDNKEEIYQEFKTGKDNWRSNKILAALWYVLDLEEESRSIGLQDASLVLGNEDIVVKIKGREYRVVFEYYKAIYFPIRIEEKES